MLNYPLDGCTVEEELQFYKDTIVRLNFIGEILDEHASDDELYFESRAIINHQLSYAVGMAISGGALK
tara:strand:+ start:274 stop:477 length:204 start_codon:yes stop_codon:yes gene_type:complete